MMPHIDPARFSVGALALFVAASLAVADISWQAPEDGGTPRDPRRIVRIGPSEFRIRACAEEGPGPLTHAVSRMDLLCRNTGTATEDVTIHGDLSDDGRRTNRDREPWGEMPRRNFLYVQAPGQSWRRIDGSVTGWEFSVRFAAAAGETKVGLSPWYSYGDYLRFVGSLPAQPHLEKKRVGTSDGGREHWELTVTDPAEAAAQKRRVFWHAREHAYETFSSFAVEGLVEFLRSPAADVARRRFVFVIHPMTNPDGVAQGFEYRSGYDYPRPRGTATGRLTFETVDRLRPDFAITWHNWIAPRDIDVLFYTDTENGRPSRRAWDLFTQRFPSPRAVGHRWESETNPLLKNWSGRDLNEGNVHQYAMKRYGTKVWGWEMPWWGRDEGDPTQHARKAGRDFARAWLATLERIDAETTPHLETSESVARMAAVVPPGQVHEFEVHGRGQVQNPFREAALVGEFTSPSGKTSVLHGFYDRGDTWRLRFTPTEEGEWQYLLRGEGVELLQRGRVQCARQQP
jgi:hypothetical protein